MSAVSGPGPKTRIEAAIAEILAGIPNPTVVELGAHRGEDTQWLYAACKGEVKYLAVEPDYRHWKALKAVCLPRKILLLTAAVGAGNEHRTLHLSVNHGGVPASSSLREPKFHLKAFPSIEFEIGDYVAVFTLDSLIQKCYLQPDFIWADIQGSEREMIQGGRGTLAKTKWLYCESYECEMYAGQMLRPEFLREMRGLGFEQVDADRDNVLMRNTQFTLGTANAPVASPNTSPAAT